MKALRIHQVRIFGFNVCCFGLHLWIKRHKKSQILFRPRPQFGGSHSVDFFFHKLNGRAFTSDNQSSIFATNEIKTSGG